MEKWMIYSKKADFNALGTRFSINPVTARIIRNRDVVGEEAVCRYLHGTKKDMYSAWLMKDMRRAVEILKEKIADRKKIRVIGDYDADGVNASCILLKGLGRCGANVDVEIPHRMLDGYGINERLIEEAYQAGIDTIITCDNGIAALKQTTYAKSLGMTIIITDHHEVPYEEMDGVRRYLVPEAHAVVNPKQEDCPYPYKGLCGAGVAYKLIQCLYEELGISESETDELLQFAAIATIGDVMELQDENRILVKEGLKLLRKTTNPGLKALMEVNGIQPSGLNSYHIGFILAPCMNVGGRLDTAKRALELLLCEDKQQADSMAGELKALNDSRKALTIKETQKACEMLEAAERIDNVVVVYLPDCHESLAGIIAGKLRERYYKPVFVLTKAEDGLKGSGRSIEGYSMFEELVKCRQYLEKFGGHPMAAGLSLKEENLEAFKQALNENCTLT
ncbi:MAG: single-stranded-DNA-specific exonuclease RecJ, partial [Lachnospiraceae bacterium]|nr:single-stranded-DNA-specific exonuclease RecJ [Lachnospiraceae bacterium]